jgi:WD40 repeat protein/serine/threonine protein kinase
MTSASVPDASLESLVAGVLDEFRERCKRGERPDVEEYAARHPQAAELLRKVLATVGLLDLSLSGEARADVLGSELPEGTLGDFRLLREVGRGGMGVVYEAEQISLRRRVALKVLPFAAVLDPRQLRRFQNEAQAAACLHHPHIVPVYGVGCERGVHFYAMQFIEGRTVADLIAELRRESAGQGAADARPSAETPPRAALPTRQSLTSRAYLQTVARLGIEAAEALDYAHEQGVVHRDVKPANLLLDARGTVWVTDFGLAQFHKDAGLTLTGDLLGTLRYMSPEQALGRRGLVDHRTDVYTLGVTLYELLTLRPAFAGDDRQELLRRIASEEPRSLRAHNPAVPAELETVVLKAMAKEPAERYVTAQELADDLRRFLDDRPIRARPPTLRRRAAKWARRHQPAVAAVAVFLAAGVLGLATSTLLINRARTEAVRQWHEAEKQRGLALERETDLRRHLYAADLHRAATAVDNRDVEMVRPLLDRHLPLPGLRDERCFAWHYLDGLHRQLSATLRGHEDWVYQVAFSPDGKTLATASKDRTVRLWDVETRKSLAVLRGHRDEVNAVAFSPCGSFLATGSDDETVRVWDLNGGGDPRTLAGSGKPVHRVAFSPDGKTLLGAAFAPASSERTTLLWDVASGQPRGRLDGCFGLAFSPDNVALAATRADFAVVLLDLADGHERLAFRGHQGHVRTARFSPDGRLLVTASRDATVRVWHVESGKDRAVFAGHTGSVRCAMFSPTGREVASTGEDGTVHLWDFERGGGRTIHLGHRSVWAAIYTPDGRGLVSVGGDGAVKFWDLTTFAGRHSLAKHREGVRSFAFSPDGHTLATASGDTRARLWRLPAGALQAFLPHRLREPSSKSVAFSPDGQSLAAGTGGGTVQLLDLATGSERTVLAGLGGDVAFVQFSPDGRLLSAGPHDGPARVYDTATWCELALPGRDLGASGSPSRIVFSPDGQGFAWNEGPSLKEWRQDTQQVRRLGVGDRHWNGFAAYSPDGRTLATTQNHEGHPRVKLWDARTLQPRTTLLGHGGEVTALAFSPDSAVLVSGSNNGEVRLWHVATARELFALNGPGGGVQQVAFAPDGQTLGVLAPSQRPGQDLYFWHAPRRAPGGTEPSPPDPPRP